MFQEVSLSRIGLILLLLGLAAPVSVVPAVDFATLYGQARAAAGTPAGVAYDYQLGMYFMKTHAPLLDHCVELNPEAARAPFRAVYVIDAAGRVREFLYERDNGFSRCVRSIVLGTEGPKPPFDDYLSPFEWEGPPRRQP